ncbi:MAG: hypothetical protein ACFFB9_08020 [Promethearchaeota archaeon]
MPALAHFGIGLATKRFAPQLPLWILLISAMFIDILSFIFLSAVWISHGLFMSVIWSTIAMITTSLITNHLNLKSNYIRITIIIGLLVFTHGILDFIGWPMSIINPNASRVPLLFDDAVNIGLGVYSNWFGTLFMDIGVFVLGLALYIHYLKKVKNKANPKNLITIIKIS